MFKKLILTIVFSVVSISWSSYTFAGPCAGNGSTQSDPNGVDAGMFTQQYELAEFESLAGCTMQFKENPNIASIMLAFKVIKHYLQLLTDFQKSHL